MFFACLNVFGQGEPQDVLRENSESQAASLKQKNA